LREELQEEVFKGNIQKAEINRFNFIISFDSGILNLSAWIAYTIKRNFV